MELATPLTQLKSFSIKKLFGERDVSISFDSNMRVLVAENGYGKTTILNALYYVATGNIPKLRKIEFESIELIFSDNEKYEIKTSDLEFANGIKDSGFFEHIQNIVPPQMLQELIDSFYTLSASKFKSSSIFKATAKATGYPESVFHNYLTRFIEKSDALLHVKSKRKFLKIKTKFPENILYLPTYRRVEIDLDLRDAEDESKPHDQINFGMRDVDILVKQITQEILTSSVEWFSKVNGQMLSQLAEGFILDETLKESIKNPEAVKIVLDRIGNNIDQATKAKITGLVESKEIFVNHDPLIYFISNLIKVYEQQKENDKAIQAFTEVCNRYLGDKMIKYNESSVSIEIIRRKNNRPVAMETLSSGEKQIISLFAKLYLQKHKNFAVFFDEPELSLSMEWQKTLLPDIINSGKCSFLFTTTHSPFIFDNEFLSYTVDLSEYIKEL